MSLASSIAALAMRIGFEVKTKIGTTHSGFVRTWVSSGCVGGQIVIGSAHNVTSVACATVGRYRVHFTLAMPDVDCRRTALTRSSSNSGQQRMAAVRTSSDLRTAQYIDIFCTATVTSFDDSSGINLVVYR